MGRPHVAGTQLSLLGREPAYRRLFFATLGSGAGTWLALVALEADVWLRTESSSWVAALLIADLLPTFAIGLLVGPLVDRLSRRRLMVGADLVRFAVFAVLPFTTSATQVVALAAVAGVATGFFRPAVYAGLPNLVQDEDLTHANSLLQTVDNLTWALGSLAGGLLVAASGVDAAYWINACTVLVSAVFLCGIPQQLLQASLAGTFGLGLMMGSAGIGLAFGAYLAGQWIERRGLANVYGISLMLMAIGIGLAAASPNVWIAAACVVISGAGNGAAVVCNALLVQRGAPDALRGRAFAVLMSSNVAMLTLGILVAGRLTDVYGPRWVWGAAAIIAAVSAVVGFLLARAAGAASPAQGQPIAVTAHSNEPGQQASL